jgi:hypothetical protein
MLQGWRYTVQVQIKVHFALELAMKAEMGRIGIALVLQEARLEIG